MPQNAPESDLLPVFLLVNKMSAVWLWTSDGCLNVKVQKPTLIYCLFDLSCSFLVIMRTTGVLVSEVVTSCHRPVWLEMGSSLFLWSLWRQTHWFPFSCSTFALGCTFFHPSSPSYSSSPVPLTQTHQLLAVSDRKSWHYSGFQNEYMRKLPYGC